MKITIEEVSGLTEAEIMIRCPEISPEITAVVAAIRLTGNMISGTRDGETYIFPLRKVLYFDTADRKSFIYTREGVFETPLRLYQIEEKTADSSFVRVNKSCILNLKAVQKLSGSFYGKITAHLETGERIEVSRNHVGDVKMKLGLGGEW